MKRKLPASEVVFELWLAGLTQAEIGARYGVKRAAVQKCLRLYTTSNGKLRYGPNLLLKYLKEHDNASYAEMTQAVGVCETTIRNYLDILESEGKIKRVKFVVLG